MDRDRARAAQEQADAIRRRSSPVQNHVIDEYREGRLSRRSFLRRMTILGMSFTTVGFLAKACAPAELGEPDEDPAAVGEEPPPTEEAPATALAVLRAGFFRPAGPIDPVLTNDEGRLAVLGQTAEYLIFSDDELNPRPQLAESWEPNDVGDVWTFNLYPEATYHDGTPVTAEDVVATFRTIADGNAASAFETFGVTADSAEAVDEHTVRFNLERPNGSFPFFVSSDNYNATILPVSFWEAYDEGSYEQDFPGSGPWILDEYEPGAFVHLVKNPDYWGERPEQPERFEVTFFEEEPPIVTAFQEGRLDFIPLISFAGASTLIDTDGADHFAVPTAQHRQVYFDTSRPPFDDKRVRQALALSLDRNTLLQGLVGGFGTLGNDHPIWEVYPMFDPDAVAQRDEDLAEARQLLEAAGHGDGLSSRLDTLTFREVPELATLIQSSAREIGVDLEVGVFDAGTYYGDYWLAAEGSMGIVNYGHRGVPDVYLGAPLLSDGTWNASHWQNQEYDDLFNEYSASPDLDSQRQLAGRIQALLNDEVPFMVPYFVDNIAITKPGMRGLMVTGMGHVDATEVQLPD
jgi:peptide/nickel transport system substrate-binding protein